MTSVVPAQTSLESTFPAAMLSAVGTKESWRKEVHRPATSTHKWWAKRLGTVFRGILTSAATPEGDDAASAYGSAVDLAGAVVLDPFSGSGVTGVEVLKLGGRAVCFDINPVATLVQRQAMQPWDMQALTTAYAAIEAACREEIDRLHRTEDGRTVLYYFWVATVECPDCSDRVRLFDSPVFSKNAYPKRVPKAQIVCPECLTVQESRYDFETATCPNGHTISQRGAVRGQVATCRHGHSFKTLSALNGSRPEYEMYAKMVANRDGSKVYEAITDWDRDLYDECVELLASWPDTAVLPRGELARGNNTDQALKWNFRQWRDFFNARQLVSLSMIATAIRDLSGPAAEREALCALFSGTLEFNNLFTSFKGEGTGAVRHMFSHHILKPERTPLEAHPWGTAQSSGAFSTLYKSRLQRAHEYKAEPADLVDDGTNINRVTGLSEPLAATIADSWDSFSATTVQAAYVATRNSADTDLPEASVDLVVTDPPYMDNVHYAELADFFHAWLQAMRPYEGYAQTPTTRRAGEVQHADPAEFGKAIEAVWAECARVLKPGGLLAFTFHQARISGWVQVVESLRRAGFVVTAVQPVKGEMTTSIVKAGTREPSNLDSVMVCRRAVDGATNPNRSIEEALATAQKELAALRDAGVDVGAGDVRSVVRGSLLAYLASVGTPLDDAVTTQVDDLATGTITALLPAA
ncbi:DNA methyltransferase [Micromonospora sp. WMMD1128]|uniref:DNA methyltransferase n=1 Tax=Micromonospora sp. WMMD1128 TaxID=3015150 RepID=UPI00248C1D4F|nr:DNA methyltransferase [Micromonospora sp. WMMD1128]WBB72677.1 DNA methyltransferase [Micromonospora sp. WMMD1128]